MLHLEWSGLMSLTLRSKKWRVDIRPMTEQLNSQNVQEAVNGRSTSTEAPRYESLFDVDHSNTHLAGLICNMECLAIPTR